MSTRPFVILFQARSGSSMLTSILDKHPQAACRHEDFDANPANPLERKIQGFNGDVILNPTTPQVFDHLLKIFSRPVAASGFKLKFPYQFFAFPDVTMSLLKRRRSLRLILLQRENIVKRLVSTQHLRHFRRSAKVVSGNLVEQRQAERFELDVPGLVDKLVTESLYRDQLLAVGTRFPHCLSVTYEQLLTQNSETLNRIADFLGIEAFQKVEPAYRKATPNDLRQIVSNYDELEQALAPTPWAIRDGGELIHPVQSVIVSGKHPSANIPTPEAIRSSTPETSQSGSDRERTKAA